MVLAPERVGLGKGAGAALPTLGETHLFQALLAVQLIVPAQNGAECTYWDKFEAHAVSS